MSTALPARTFSVGESDFLLDGQPYQVISGALHYFRVLPELWQDRLRKARQLGLNTIETYVAWNFHSSERGEFRTDGPCDLGRFIDLAAEEGLHVIVRPGPYICAEWSSGGLPDWLLATPGIGLRRTDDAYLAAVTEFYSQVLDIVVDRLITRGGPVIAMQIENEYGAYGDDADYLRTLTALVRDAGVDVPLVTCDQANDEMLSRGGLPELHKTATFGSRSAERLATLRKHQPTGPLMCMEFWDGWFDSWGRPHHVTSAEQSAADLDALLAAGASVNLYMFHGGTNFGVTNGANHKGTYLPIATSYDYDAPLAEDGTPTAKYWAFREVIGRYVDLPADAPAEREPAPTPSLTLDAAYRWRDLVEALDDPVAVSGEPALDLLGTGVTLAEFTTPVREDDAVLAVDDVCDRANVAVDGVAAGILDRTSRALTVALPPRAGSLSVLLEDRGRVNYGTRIGERKVVAGPRTRLRSLDEWSARAVPLATLPAVLPELPAIEPQDTPWAGPVVFAGTLQSEPGRDHHLRLDGWTRGYVWIDGFLLGRYSSEPPTRTLLVPGPLVRAGGSRIVILELSGTVSATVAFDEAPDLGDIDE